MSETPPIHLYTVGYGNRPWDEVVALLRRYEIAYVLDVRSRPFSKFRPEFRHDLLRDACAQAGLHYAYVGQALGGMPTDSVYLDAAGKPDHAKMAVRPAFRQAMQRLATAHELGHRCALMCGCLRPNQCHRGKLIGPELIRAGLPFRHIDAEGGLMTHEQMIDEETRGQPDLFAL